ncbi:IS66-like element ISMno13 family transposase [Methylobacterium nodulans]|uniref:Transposase IS66 n=1 Tax=Methylobacterium nodulans (strain LMG 21967 / CNCM I-2342 / ORS 2060) TaxID=460265 RepID=B8IAF1_METNO|nr:IS66-like element ISMno13 family transposase [Methylobacterium nodulans]ACL59214.1 transposase IS66 [Methylobacterium nodulans ORS 2060]ACL61117.1 transposase IS66 [Methylobacterium nodulans ORS 2060]ACL62505.1 transposase IS66 [Methylobacterium nodulans ORS 2060]
MAAPASPSPDDPETLKALLAEERAENERLRQIIKAMQRHRFGRRAESLPEDQLLLGLEEAEQVEAEGLAAEETAPAVRAERTARRRNNRGALPAHLPRVERVVDIESPVCPCCSGSLHRIGEDVSERLDIVPAQVRVIVIRRPRYACRACEAIVLQASAPARLIEGGLPTDDLVAHVLVAKYADHLPLYRQAQIFARQGIALDRSTLADWVGRAAFLLRPVHARLLGRLKASGKLFADETSAPVLDPGRGRTKTGQLWAYARDDRPWGGTDPPGVAYVYAPDRTAKQPIAHLAGFRGVLQVDGYDGYKALARQGEVRLAYCWSHVRRAFYDLDGPIAAEVLTRIAGLYRIEAEIRGRPAEERRTARQARSRPILEALEPWLREKLALISQKSKLAEAIRYALSRWAGLSLFLDDGRVELDTNVVERAIRPLALTRKNALFAGSDGGAAHWAVIASLIETCKLTGVGPQAYLADVITRIIEGHPNSRIDELLPWAYPVTPTLRDVA